MADDAGNDFLSGGDGSDVFVWEPGDGSDVIEGGAGDADVLAFFGGAGAEVFNVFAKLSDPARAISVPQHWQHHDGHGRHRSNQRPGQCGS